jgi:hypothetical protein
MDHNAFTVQRTERGWAGHFICANRCRFRRNTLLKRGDTRIVVSTVGLLVNIKGDGFETVGNNRYFETMAFYAAFDGRYWDADVSRQISFESPWCISEVDADDRANDQHEAVVWEISDRLASGYTDFARSGEAFNQLEESDA